MSTPEIYSHIARMVFGNIEDLRSSLAGVTDLADIEEALLHARALREGKTKVALLERHLRQVLKAKASK
jgi:hypothetical protein